MPGIGDGGRARRGWHARRRFVMETRRARAGDGRTVGVCAVRCGAVCRSRGRCGMWSSGWGRQSPRRPLPDASVQQDYRHTCQDDHNRHREDPHKTLDIDVPPLVRTRSGRRWRCGLQRNTRHGALLNALARGIGWQLQDPAWVDDRGIHHALTVGLQPPFVELEDFEVAIAIAESLRRDLEYVLALAVASTANDIELHDRGSRGGFDCATAEAYAGGGRRGARHGCQAREEDGEQRGTAPRGNESSQAAGQAARSSVCAPMSAPFDTHGRFLAVHYGSSAWLRS